MEEPLKEFKTSYTAIFSINYFIQGISQSLFSTIIPIYIIIQLSALGAGELGGFATIVLLPFAVKFIYGIISDKFSSKKLGRRKPWIIGPLIMSGLIWIILPFFVTTANVLMLFTIGGVFIVLGIAMADTAIDGLILDNCPKKQLGRVQGICWGFRSVGIITGGPLLVLIFYLSGIDIEWIFIGYGIIIIASSFSVLIVKEIRVIQNVQVGKNLKLVFGKGKNWTVFAFALFNAFIDGVIFLFITVFVLFQAGIVGFSGGEINIDIIEESITNQVIYGSSALVNLIIGLGVIIGAVIGGWLADIKSRKLSFYSSMLITTISLLLFLINTWWGILLFFALLIGASSGWRNSGFSAIIGQESTQYPEVDVTYYATCNSFANIGTVIGLTATSTIFGLLADMNFYFQFAVVLIFLAIVSNIGIIPFWFMKEEEYELPEKIGRLD
ncbi:MAG: MFS transporter [Promethearchaeota archaeon]|nr:MAG: MFS transporter [Candidatus Lokiarchaeota archaeon]